jgi:hypothetical protein
MSFVNGEQAQQVTNNIVQSAMQAASGAQQDAMQALIDAQYSQVMLSTTPNEPQ